MKMVHFFAVWGAWAGVAGAIKPHGSSAAAYGALRAGLEEIAPLRSSVDGGACVPRFGAVADAIDRKSVV